MTAEIRSMKGPMRQEHRRAHLFQKMLAAVDALIIALTIVGAHLAHFGPADVVVDAHISLFPVTYYAVDVILAVSWWLLLVCWNSYRERLLGSGPEEYERVIQATLIEFSALAILSYLLQVRLSRGLFLVILPVGLILLVLWRWTARQIFVSLRRKGRYMHPVAILASSESVVPLAREISRRPELGLQVRGLYVPVGEAGPEDTGGFEFLGDFDDFTRDLAAHPKTSVVIGNAARTERNFLRSLAWTADAGSTIIIPTPFIDATGPRAHLRPVDGLPLMEITVPQFDGTALVVKRLLDIITSGLLILALTPVWLVVAALVRFEDGGPVFFRQVRIGTNGEEFRIWKFRTMRVDADAELAALLAKQGTSDTPLFKVDDDPRITRIGKFLRESSIDELPQLFNVFAGSMSLVGPRPQVPKEVALYDPTAALRLRAKPGMTGLWQVSGRSSLTWEEAVRLDLFYVENWSLAMDLRILVRTFRAVLERDGSQ